MKRSSRLKRALVPENFDYTDTDTDLSSMIGEYLGGMDKRSRLFDFTATFYSKEEVQGHMPASGVRGSTLREALVGNGLLQVAVDPKIIPMFTRFNVRLWDGGESVKAIALDVGGSIKNRIIDIFVDKTSEAILLGRKKVYVEFYD
ncbi:peptidase M23 [Brachionus plicatilis]|uniref:Peptidase M23 n=1 Tax=Brachionus plicatilis TaxID=10195 RepID=A0A3M7RSQ7_BRAPC|nr:peptidase M23 [Brachionus plicatilis]